MRTAVNPVQGDVGAEETTGLAWQNFSLIVTKTEEAGQQVKPGKDALCAMLKTSQTTDLPMPSILLQWREENCQPGILPLQLSEGLVPRRKQGDPNPRPQIGN